MLLLNILGTYTSTKKVPTKLFRSTVNCQDEILEQAKTHTC